MGLNSVSDCKVLQSGKGFGFFFFDRQRQGIIFHLSKLGWVEIFSSSVTGNMVATQKRLVQVTRKRGH